jgi:hypothetical protein
MQGTHSGKTKSARPTCCTTPIRSACKASAAPVPVLLLMDAAVDPKLESSLEMSDPWPSCLEDTVERLVCCQKTSWVTVTTSCES